MNFTEYLTEGKNLKTLKSIAQKSRFSKKYNLKITYV